MKEPALVIGLGGLTGTGKTTISRLLRKQFSIPVIPVSYFLGLEARKRGLTTKAWAEKLVETGGPKAVVESITSAILKLAKRNQIFIIEGLYRPEDYRVIQRLFPKSKTILISMNADRESRVERIVKRQKLSKEEAEKWVTRFDEDRRKVGIEELHKMADITIHNKKTLPQLNRELLEKISTKTGAPLQNRARKRRNSARNLA